MWREAAEREAPGPPGRADPRSCGANAPSWRVGEGRGKRGVGSIGSIPSSPGGEVPGGSDCALSAQ
eukprot:1245444-Alexandrium_andersonii.AAC.1